VTSRRTLRTFAAASAAIGVLAGCGSSSHAPALNAAGPKAFSYDIAHRNFAGPVFAKSDQAKVLTLGQSLCAALDKGHTVAQLNEGLLATKSLKASAAEDGEFVSTVVVTLCPKYVAQITGGLASSAPTSGTH
jgi:hypothetical protein